MSSAASRKQNPADRCRGGGEGGRGGKGGGGGGTTGGERGGNSGYTDVNGAALFMRQSYGKTVRQGIILATILYEKNCLKEKIIENSFIEHGNPHSLYA